MATNQKIGLCDYLRTERMYYYYTRADSTRLRVALVNPYLADSVAYSVPDDFTYKFDGINVLVQYSYR